MSNADGVSGGYSVWVRFFGMSSSFPSSQLPLESVPDEADADVLVLAGSGAGAAFMRTDTAGKVAVLLELQHDCLGEYTGESRGLEGSNVVGFSRFSLGNLPPTNLVELVKQPATGSAAIQAARDVFHSAGLTTAVGGDFVGRIVDRLIRPYFNSALRALDEGLATADDLDLTVCLGLGHPEGPIALLERSGLANHFKVSQILYQLDGDHALMPARRARVAKYWIGRAHQ